MKSKQMGSVIVQGQSRDLSEVNLVGSADLRAQLMPDRPVQLPPLQLSKEAREGHLVGGVGVIGNDWERETEEHREKRTRTKTRNGSEEI